MNSKTRSVVAFGAMVALLGAGVGGCANWTATQKGAVVGGTAGAVVGGAIGKRSGSTAAGVLVGAAVGGTAGAMIGREMDRKAERLARELEGAQVARVGEGIVVTFESGLTFDFDSAVLRPNARRDLERFARTLREDPRTDILVLGHTCTVGRAEYNQGLSERRAASAASYLMSQGVPASRMRTRGMGQWDPVASNDTEYGREQNRRVEIVIVAGDAWRQQAQRAAAE